MLIKLRASQGLGGCFGGVGFKKRHVKSVAGQTVLGWESSEIILQLKKFEGAWAHTRGIQDGRKDIF